MDEDSGRGDSTDDVVGVGVGATEADSGDGLELVVGGADPGAGVAMVVGEERRGRRRAVVKPKVTNRKWSK